MKNGIVFMGMGFELVGIMLAGLYVGKIIDEKMGWKGIGVAACVIILLIGWFVHLFVLLKRFMDANDKDQPGPSSPNS